MTENDHYMERDGNVINEVDGGVTINTFYLDSKGDITELRKRVADLSFRVLINTERRVVIL